MIMKEKHGFTINSRSMRAAIIFLVLTTLLFVILYEHQMTKSGGKTSTFYQNTSLWNAYFTRKYSHTGDKDAVEKSENTTVMTKQTPAAVDCSAIVKIDGIPKKFSSPEWKLLKILPKPRPMLDIIIKPWKVTPERVASQNLTGDASNNQHSKDIHWTMLALIKSAANHFGRRLSVRKTWGKMKLYKGVRLEIVFLIGKSSENKTEEKLMEENHQHGDILQMDIRETYKNLAFKIETGMRWASQNFPPSWLCIDTDDDVFPKLPEIFRVIKDMKTQEKERYRKSLNAEITEEKLMENLPFYCGFHLTTGAKPRRERNNKFYISHEDFPAAEFPPYCEGPWFALPVKLAGYLTDITQCLPVFWIEDIWLSGYARLIHYTTVGSNVTLNWGKPEVGMWTKQRGGLAHHFQGAADNVELWKKTFNKTFI